MAPVGGVFYGFRGPKPTWDRMKRHWERPENTFVHFSVFLGAKNAWELAYMRQSRVLAANLGAAGGPGGV